MNARRIEVSLSQDKIDLIDNIHQKELRVLQRGSLKKGFRQG